MQYLSFVFDAVKTGLPLALIVVAGYVAYLVVTKGGSAAKTAVTGWLNKGKAEFAAVESRVTALEVHLGLKAAAPAAPAGHPGVSGPAK